MARPRKTRARRGAMRGARSVRKPGDWVTTFEGWDNSDATNLGFVTTDTEVVLPLVNTYIAWGINSEDVTSPPGTYTRGLPWLRRTVKRVRGWLYVHSPDYLAGNHEMLVNVQLEKFRTDPLTGVVLGTPNFLATNEFEVENTIYWQWQRHLFHSSSWTSPEDYNTFKHSIYVNASMNVRLDEIETLGIRITNRGFLSGARLLVRPMLRTYVVSG